MCGKRLETCAIPLALLGLAVFLAPAQPAHAGERPVKASSLISATTRTPTPPAEPHRRGHPVRRHEEVAFTAEDGGTRLRAATNSNMLGSAADAFRPAGTLSYGTVVVDEALVRRAIMSESRSERGPPTGSSRAVAQP